MRSADEKEIIQYIKTKRSSVYLLAGESVYLLTQYLKLLLNQIGVDRDDGFNFQEFASADSMDEIRDACMTLPVFAPQKVVLVKDVSAESMTKDQLESLLEIVREVPQETVLILAGAAETVDEKKSSKWKKLIQAADQAGAVFLLTSRTGSNLIKTLQAKLSEAGVEISRENAQWLCDRCALDMDILLAEADKLIAFQQSGEIARESMEKLVSVQLESSVYDLSKTIRRGDYQKACELLMVLKELQQEPIMILATLTGSYLDLLRAKAVMERGEGADSMKRDFSYRGREFLIRNALQDAKKLSWENICDSLDVLRTADLNCKNGSGDPYYILDKAVTELFVVQARGA